MVVQCRRGKMRASRRIVTGAYVYQTMLPVNVATCWPLWITTWQSLLFGALPAPQITARTSTEKCACSSANCSVPPCSFPKQRLVSGSAGSCFENETVTLNSRNLCLTGTHICRPATTRNHLFALWEDDTGPMKQLRCDVTQSQHPVSPPRGRLGWGWAGPTCWLEARSTMNVSIQLHSV